MGKKLIFVTLILLIAFFPLISSINFDMKENFNRGETLTAKISGYFLSPILKENIFFYRGHVRIAMNYDLTKIGEDYYIYADLSEKIPGNYSIVIQNARYIEFTMTVEEDIVKNFTISKDWADFYVLPGFVIAEDDFSVNVRNIQNEELTVDIKINPENETKETNETSVTLSAGETEKVNFLLTSFSQGLNIIEFSTENLKYEIPVNAFFTEKAKEEGEGSFKFEPGELNISLSTNSETSRILYLYNTGTKILKNISISASNSLKPYVELSTENVDELENDSNIALEVFFTSPEDEENLDGYIKAKSSEDEGDILAYSQIYLSFVKDYVPQNEEKIPASAKTCSELNGEICAEDETCKGDEIYAKDNKCCLGNCEKEKQNNTGRIIGWGLLGVAFIFLIWFFLKHKKIKKPVDLLKIAKGKK